MKTRLAGKPLLGAAVLLLATAGVASAQNIYKCTRAGRLEYTDRPCPNGELIHRADNSEIIDQYLRLGQVAAAKRYADAHHLEALYRQRLDARQQAMAEQARRQADEAIAAQQRAEEDRQQAAADEAAERERLRAENEALRQQNQQYRDQLTQPVYIAPPIYWGVPPPRRHRRDEHDPHRPPPAKEPASHPCKQLAGGRVTC